MLYLPPELRMFRALKDSQPLPVREAFQYCLCLMMVEAGKMKLIDTTPGDAQALYHFRAADGETFAIPRPDITSEQESQITELLIDILKDEGLL